MMNLTANRYRQSRAGKATGLAVLFFSLSLGAGWLPGASLAAGPELRQPPAPAAGPQLTPGRPQVLAKPVPDRQQTVMKKSTKIKLHRGAKDDYAWDLTGENVEEILRIDRRLHKAFAE